MLPKDRPNLILIDEVLNYVSTYRSLEYNDRLYNFLQSLSETVRGETNTVLVVSIPASEMEYTEKDEADEQRFKKMLDRLGLAIMMSAESETSEIIRHRLFDWDSKYISAGDKIMLSKDAIATCNEYADWMVEHRQQLPNWFDIDNAREVFKATYPFHPTLLSVFERKWQALPRFQRTRGVLRMLAMWLSDAYDKGFTGAHKDPLITLGTAPLDNMDFRSVVFEQMGDGRLEGAVTSDIDGKKDAHAPRLDTEAVADIKKARLHRKVATAIFFESNGGCTRAEATIPEIRLDVADPSLDIGHIETVLETIEDEFYYISIEKNKYHFTLYPNLNKILADRRASVKNPRIDEYVRSYVQQVFTSAQGITPKFFPEDSTGIPNRPELAIAVIAPERSMSEPETLLLAERLIRESGGSDRTFKSAIIVAIAESNTQMCGEARKLLAWEDIRDNEPEGITDSQVSLITENVAKAKRDLKESVWRSYKYIAMLGKDSTVQTTDMGLITSSSGSSMTSHIIQELRKVDQIQDSISPRFLVRNWPPAFKEWSTRSVRDVFFASPQFPRLLNPNAIKDIIAKGVSSGEIAYVGKAGDRYEPFKYQVSLNPNDIEVSDDVFIITGEEAQAYEERSKEPPTLTTLTVMPRTVVLEPGYKQAYTVQGFDQWGTAIEPGSITWSAIGGDIDSEGVLNVGNDLGNFTVTAKTGSTSTTVNFTVHTKTVSDDRGSSGGSSNGSAPTSDPPHSTASLRWKGEIPTQKWTTFYTRVLSKFSSDKSINLTLTVEVNAEGNVSEQKRQEAEAALRELGLEGNFFE